MASKVVKSESYASELVSAVGNLYLSRRFSDVEVSVETEIFQCHKLVLVMQSSYFQECFFRSSETDKCTSIKVDDASPENFRNILRYLYRGEVELNHSNVGSILCLSKRFCLEAVKKMCLKYLEETLDVSTCLQYWKMAESEKELELKLSCFEVFVKQFNQFAGKDLNLIPQEMMKAAIQRDDLNITEEQDLCEVLLKWFDASRVNEQCIHLLPILYEIRWSGVSIAYIKSNFIGHELLANDPQCFTFLSRVISYRLTGTQFPGLRTHHRPSTELESCFLTFGTNDEVTRKRDCYRISLQKQNGVNKIVHLPTEMNAEVSACVSNNSVFITGFGKDNRQTWRWDLIGGWTRCGDMVKGRRRHFTTFIDDNCMYALGGYDDTTQMALSSVEQYNRVTNKWKQVGTLSQCADSAGGVAYKSLIYLFGGSHYDAATKDSTLLDCIQEYDTTKRSDTCTLLTQRLPRPFCLLRAALWDESVILITNDTTFIFNLEKKTVQEQDQFKSDCIHFGLVIDNQTLFIIGGGNDQTDSNGKTKWTCSDEVKSVPVMDIIDNKQTVTWTQHAKLTSPSLIDAFGLVTIDRCSQ